MKLKLRKKETKTDQSAQETKAKIADQPDNKRQFKTHINEVNCKQCLSERVHECRDDIVRVRGRGVAGGGPLGAV